MASKFFHMKRAVALILLLAFLSLLGQDILLARVLLPQESAQELLKKGIQQYENAEFELAVETLQKALQTGLQNKQDVMEAHKYLAFSYAAVGEDQNSKLQFLKVLEIKPDFDLPVTASPRLLEPLDLAKQEFVPKDTEPPTIIFSPPAEVNENTTIQLSAEVTDPSGVSVVRLFYKKAAEPQYKKVSLNRSAGNTYQATIPAEDVTVAGIELYLQATDQPGNKPAQAGTAESPLKISVQMVDTEPPTITHTPVATAQENTEISIQAQIMDRSGVERAKLFYRKVGDTEFRERALKSKDGIEFTASIPAKAVTESGVEYYLEVVDKTGNPPALVSSPEMPVKVNVSIVDLQPPVIVHTPITPTNENQPLKISADITDRSAIAEVNLFYKSSHADTYTKLKMAPAEADGYTTEIPTEAVTPDKLAYYIEAIDVLNNTAFLGTKDKPLIIKVDIVDTEPPSITHTPIEQAVEGEEINFIAMVTDKVGVAEVRIFYRVTGQTDYRSSKMQQRPNNVFLAKIAARAEGMEYYMTATDRTGNTPAFWKSADDPQLFAVQAKPVQVAKKGGSKALLWIGLGAVAVSGGLVVALAGGGGGNGVTPLTDQKLPNPPGDPGGN